jgi:hypothetical protein
LTKANGDFTGRIQGCEVSVKTLYRKWAAYRNNDYDALVDNRGKWKKGKSGFPQEVRDLFEYLCLDGRALSVSKCYETMKLYAKQQKPGLLENMPSYDTAYKWAKEISAPVATLAREGGKAFDDRCGAYIDRMYDDMFSKQIWVADCRRIDLVSRPDANGEVRTHRLTLCAIVDARSLKMLAWSITENPESNTVLLTLGKAIRQYGLPDEFYADNGREFLANDLRGPGHRRRKNTAGKAKIIERCFRTLTAFWQMFETHCGSGVAAKPEKLKSKLKAGQIILDSELIENTNILIEGYYNTEPYNGKVRADAGFSRNEEETWSIFTVTAESGG